MQIKSQPMGEYQTNCYIVSVDGGDIIIDPGIGAVEWVKQNAKNPIAILNTHGHFDHVWSDKQLQEELGAPLYIPRDDSFMLSVEVFGHKVPQATADVKVEPDESFEIGGAKVVFHYFPGHTPGCSAIQIDDALFSGDFIFKNSIGRVDFPYSEPMLMKRSIQTFLGWQQDMPVYPGHGPATTVKAEQKTLPFWIDYV